MAGIAATGGGRPLTESGKRAGSRYVLGDLLGRGGMAEVFAGHSVGDHGFQKPVAIKRLLPELANDEVFVERLIEEAKLLVGMQHGNIVSVLDLAREGDDVFLVMEFVDGPSLRQLIKARGSRGLSLGVATYIVQSAAAGLEFAHARPGGAIIHADISPSNLLLTTSGEVRVADFGIARREGLGQGVVEGKWAYMAPEQARGEPLTPPSDVFALGVVLYELLTGQHPFGRAVTANERDEPMRVIPPRVVKPSIPPGLDAICMRALAHAARERYGRMQHMIDALVEERFTNGYRDGAADLATAIREVVPNSDVGAPRTMHTDRPITIMTRSLLRDLTPARRGSHALLPPTEPVPVAAPERERERGDRSDRIQRAASFDAPFAYSPPTGVATSAFVVAEPPPGALLSQRPTELLDPAMAPVHTGALTAFVGYPESFAPPLPGSIPGTPPASRIADQVALAQAAEAAAALLAIPTALRAEGTPMPPFRLAERDMRGEELASVVGGNTFTGHAGIAVEARAHRWTIMVLGAAALVGAVTAIAFQMGPSRSPDSAVDLLAAALNPIERQHPAAKPPAMEAPAVVSQAVTAAAPGPVEHEPAPHALPPKMPDPVPTLPATEPSKPADGAAGGGSGEPFGPHVAAPQEAAMPDTAAAPDSAAAAKLAPLDAAAAKPARGDGKGEGDGAATAKPPRRDGDRPAGKSSRSSRRDDDAPAGTRSGERRPRASESRVAEARSADTKSAKRPGAKDGKRKADGVLSVQSMPWSWVTVDTQTKETPARFSLAPGIHIVQFHNDENGITKYERVLIVSEDVYKLNEDMEH